MNKCKPKYKHKNSHKRQTLAYLVSVYECAHIIRVFERMCSFDLIEIYKNLTVSRVLSHLNFMRWVCKCVPVHFRRLRVRRRCGFTIILVFFFAFFLISNSLLSIVSLSDFLLLLLFSLPCMQTHTNTHIFGVCATYLLTLLFFFFFFSSVVAIYTFSVSCFLWWYCCSNEYIREIIHKHFTEIYIETECILCTPFVPK